VGTAAAVPAARLLQALLAGVTAGDGWTFAVAAGVTALLVGAGTLVPVVRAGRIDPQAAIRGE
jgi:hypothetical protein